MPLTIITAATSEPITLDELRAQCRIDGSDEDVLLTIYIAAARAKAEGILGRPLITRTLEQAFDAFPDLGAALQLEGTPAQSVASVTYLDSAGTQQTLAGSAYALDLTNALTPYLRLTTATTWPTTADKPNAVRVRYVVGFGNDGAAVPADVRAWLLLTGAYLWAHREAIDSTGKAIEVPGRFVDALLDPWRNYAS